MLQSIDDSLVEFCGVLGHSVTLVGPHEDLCPLYTKRNLVERLVGILAELPKTYRGLYPVNYLAWLAAGIQLYFQDHSNTTADH